jgi:hypothetical protein
MKRLLKDSHSLRSSVFPLVVLLSFAACATNRPKGAVALGDTPEKVQSVYGKPDRVYKRVTASGDVEAWGYMQYWIGFGMPTEPISGGRPQVSADVPLEAIRDDEDVRVFFKGGKVAAVEYRSNK